MEETKLCGRCNKPKGDGEGFCRCGRPTDYTTDKEMCAKVDEYIAKVELEDKLPMIEDFALMLGKDDDTIVEWRKKYPKFSAACKKIDIKQKISLARDGLSEKYNPGMAKFLLSANHGMREKSDVTTDDKPVEGVNMQTLIAIAKELKNSPNESEQRPNQDSSTSNQ